jgi:hypothetical protein
MIDDIQSVRIVDLIEAGLLPRSARLRGNYGEHSLEATLRRDGTFVCGSTISSSPSVAADSRATYSNIDVVIIVV